MYIVAASDPFLRPFPNNPPRSLARVYRPFVLRRDRVRFYGHPDTLDVIVITVHIAVL